MPNVLTLEPTYVAKKLPEGMKKILFLGRINPLKGSEDLLEIIPYICSKRNDVIFEICGTFTDPSDEKVYIEKLHDLIQSKRVFLRGQIIEVSEKLLETTLLIFAIVCRRVPYGYRRS